MRWIDATNLKQWAVRRDCQEILPLLIKRLIRATVKEINNIHFPSGESVQFRGWDGILNAKSETEFIPSGESAWEISARKNFKCKAETDFNKRTENPLGINISEATYICVTPYSWSNKDEWCSEKKPLNKWKDIRVYDSDDMEDWLEQAPAVAAWLAEHLGIFPKGVESAIDYWERKSLDTTPNLTYELILSGRITQVESIHQWLQSGPTSLTVNATTKDEAIFFLIASAYKLDDINREKFISRCLIVNNIDAFKHAALCDNSLILVNNFNDNDAIGEALNKGHHVFIPIDPSNTITQNAVKLPRLDREEFISALKEMGIDEEEASTLSKKSGRSLSVLRRILSKSKFSAQPDWASNDNARDIIPALLIGRWSGTVDKDCKSVSVLASLSYGEYLNQITNWLVKPDSPFYKIGNLWCLKSPVDAWFALSPFISTVDLEKFRNLVLQILSEINPSLELDEDKRWIADIYNKTPEYSSWIRKGVVQTLVLLAEYGDDSRQSATSDAVAWVDDIVRKLLNNARGELWISLTDILPIIAEASPSAFLDAVEKSLAVDNPPVIEMFSETDDFITSSSPHTGLLWALESLAWNPLLLSQVIIIMGRLASLDPGGKLLNRPSNCLRKIFLPWLPQTYASTKDRISAIDCLIENEPQVSLNLLLELLPKNSDHCSPTYKPRWRQCSQKQDNRVTFEEEFQFIDALNERVLRLVGNDALHWSLYFPKVSNLLPEQRIKTYDCFETVIDELSGDKKSFVETVRKMLSSHRTFSDAKWALPEKELIRVEEFYNKLLPKESIYQQSWLFDDQFPELPAGRERKDHSRYQDLIKSHRINFLKNILDKKGLNGIINYAKNVKEPNIVGQITAELEIRKSEEYKIINLLDKPDDMSIKIYSENFIHCKAFIKGDVWISSCLKYIEKKEVSNKIKIMTLVSLPEKQVVWDSLIRFEDDIVNDYWKNCDARYYHLTKEEKIFGIRNVLKAGRYLEAIHRVSLYAKELPAGLILDMLKNALAEPIDSNNKFRINSYDIEKLFAIIDQSEEVNDQEIAKLEWGYIPVFSGVGSRCEPKRLHKLISDDPTFFTKLIKLIYLPKNGHEEQELTKLSEEIIQARAKRANDLLKDWRTIPGAVQKIILIKQNCLIGLTKVENYVMKQED